MRKRIATGSPLIGICAILNGCVAVPERSGFAAVDVNEVVKRIKCDLYNIALQKADESIDGRRPFFFLKSWAARIHMTLAVDDSVAVNPGATLSTPLATVNGVGQSLALGIGAGFSTQAIRTEDVDFLVSFSDIEAEARKGVMNGPMYDGCIAGQGTFLESDLGLDRLIDTALAPVASGILTPGNNIGPNVGPPPAIPAVQLAELKQGKSIKVDSSNTKAPVKPISEFVQALPKLAPQANRLIELKNFEPNFVTVPTDSIPSPRKGDAEVIKKILANSSDASSVETKTQAIITNIVKPLYAIAQSSLDGSCIGPVTKSHFGAIAQSANVSIHVVEADKADTLKQSDDALNAANGARDQVIQSANSMIAGIRACGPASERLKADRKALGPPKFDPISAISETVNFYVVTTGSMTPSWKLVRVSAPLAGTFLSGTRKYTNTLILTMGRPVPGANGTQANPAMDGQVLSSILSQALINANR